VPLWLTQTLVGLAALAVGQTTGNIYLVMYMLCAIFALAVCAEAIGTQLHAKGWAKPIALGSVLLACAVTTTAAEYVGLMKP
jgi:alkylation response protein AidB-like acyl-CoA dehydrogenase